MRNIAERKHRDGRPLLEVFMRINGQWHRKCRNNLRSAMEAREELYRLRQATPRKYTKAKVKQMHGAELLRRVWV